MRNCNVLLDKTTVRNWVFHNRYACAPFDIGRASDEGIITDELLSIYGRRKGPSLMVAEQAYINPAGQWRKNQIAVDRDECIPGLTELAAVIHRNGQVAVLQINHAGSTADPALTKMEAEAPSAIVHPLLKRSTPKRLEITDLERIREEFVHAALRLKKAGFDGVELHSCHGFLLSQFLSPLTNDRTDRYGGNLENRSRFLMEVTAAVREAVGEDFLLMVRLGLDDFLPGGFTLSEGCKVAERLQEAGIDILDTSSGLKPAPLFSGNAFFRDMFRTVKQHVNVPVMGSGQLEDIDTAAEMVENGEIDFIGLARSILKQPDYVEGLIQTIKMRGSNPDLPV